MVWWEIFAQATTPGSNPVNIGDGSGLGTSEWVLILGSIGTLLGVLSTAIGVLIGKINNEKRKTIALVSRLRQAEMKLEGDIDAAAAKQFQPVIDELRRDYTAIVEDVKVLTRDNERLKSGAEFSQRRIADLEMEHGECRKELAALKQQMNRRQGASYPEAEDTIRGSGEP